LRQLSSVALIAVWVAIAIWLLGIRQPTRALAADLTSRSTRLVLLWLVLLLLDAVLTTGIVRVADNLESGLFVSAAARARLALRRSTIVRAAENLKSIALWVIAIIATLSILSVSAASVLTIGAVIAFALSFAMQNLIKDYLNGFLILAEDQYAIGDYITINAFSGTVEDLTLRITRLRADDGRLVTIPNSSVSAVENQTRTWSRIDFKVAISPSSDIARACTVLGATLEEIAKDPKWRRSIMEAPQVLGVDDISHAGIVLRAWIKTIPEEKARLTREINRQVSETFRKEKIGLGIPQSIVLQPAPAAEPKPQ
jgi:small conductance mechanosensitive channel